MCLERFCCTEKKLNTCWARWKCFVNLCATQQSRLIFHIRNKTVNMIIFFAVSILARRFRDFYMQEEKIIENLNNLSSATWNKKLVQKIIFLLLISHHMWAIFCYIIFMSLLTPNVYDFFLWIFSSLSKILMTF